MSYRYDTSQENSPSLNGPPETTADGPEGHHCFLHAEKDARILTTLVAALFLLIGTAGSARAQTPSIAPEANAPQDPGAEFSVDIRVGSTSVPVSNLFGVSFVLDYDPRHLSVVSDQVGSFLGDDIVSSTNNDASAGAFGIGLTRKSGADGVSGDGVVWTVRFKVDDAAPPGQTLPFAITDVSASDPTGASISLDPRTLDVTVTNTAPTITGLSDQTIDEDGSTGALPFTVGDVETAPSNLTVTAISDDQTLLPDANITLGGSGTNRTIEAQPSADQNGQATVTVTVRDGAEQATSTFTLTVNAVNDPPTIIAISDQTIDEDQTLGLLPFTVGDVETAPSNLTVTATSSDPALLPDANLTLGGSGTNRTIEAMPTPNQSGTAAVTVTVTDRRGAEASATFTLTVNPVNDPPSVLAFLPDGAIEIPGPPLELAGLQGGVFRDVDGDLTFTATSSNLSVVSVEENQAQDKAASSGSVMLRPVATGAAQITITASDGTAEVAAEPFTLTVVDAEAGRKMPKARSRAMVRPNGNGATGVGFGVAGSEATFRGVRQGGTINVTFFDGTEGKEAAASTAGKHRTKAETPEAFSNVSPYRWKIDAGGAQFDAVDVGVRLSDADVTGVGDPSAVTVLVDATGDGTFETAPTRFDDGGTPGDVTDDRLVAEGLTVLGTFRLASNSDQNPLPVELAAFTAPVDGSAALLRWKTASETNNAGFEVKHRRSATMRRGASGHRDVERGWQRVGFVEGAGTTTEPQRYRFRVEDLTPGTHRFRLRQVDTDGTATLTDAVTVVVKAERMLSLRATGPNPVRQATQFAFTVERSGRATVTLYNVLGQEVRRLHDREATVGQRYAVDLSAADLPSGTYFVRLSAPGDMRVQRIVVVR